jgi:hypothetical protein
LSVWLFIDTISFQKKKESGMTVLQGNPTAERVAWALERSHPCGPEARRGVLRFFAPRRQKAASEHLYFSVRPIAAAGGRQILQYGFADDRGNIVLSVCGEAVAPWHGPELTPPEDLATTPMDPDWLTLLIRGVCQDASLVTFHKVLQGGLLPPGAIDGAASLECAWRRYLRLARRRGCFDRSEPVTLDDALETAGLGAVGAPDAALRALGVRELWTWMDSL